MSTPATTERSHGTRAKYVVEQCRCPECRRANCEYQKQRERRKAYEAWGDVTPALVPADEARAHLAFLSSAGVGSRRVSRLTGVSRSTLGRLKRTSVRVRPETADRILGLCTDDL